MALFGRKAATGSADAPSGVEVIRDASGRSALVFGVTWRSLVSASASTEKDALKLARSSKSTHYVMLGRQVGFARLPTQEVKSDDPPVFLPASLLASKHFGGNGIFALRLMDAGEIWFGVIRNGAPTSVDEIHKHWSDSESLERLEQLRAGLQEEAVDFEVYSDIEGAETVRTRACSIDELFHLISENKSQVLRPLPRQSLSIPKPVLIAMAMVFLLLMASKLFDAGRSLVSSWWPSAPVAAAPPEDPAALWTAVFNRWLSLQVGANKTGVLQAREALAGIPAEISGWRLRSASCAARAIAPDAGRKREWDCQAAYERLVGAVLTRDVISRLPQAWSVTISPLDAFKGSWTFTEEALPALDMAGLRALRDHQIQTASELQRVQPALGATPALEFKAVNLDPPKASDGKPYGAEHAPQALQDLRAASISLKGPMRSFDYALSRTSIDADWTRLSLTLTSGNGGAGQTPIRASRLEIEATGVLYAKK